MPTSREVFYYCLLATCFQFILNISYHRLEKEVRRSGLIGDSLLRLNSVKDHYHKH